MTLNHKVKRQHIHSNFLKVHTVPTPANDRRFLGTHRRDSIGYLPSNVTTGGFRIVAIDSLCCRITYCQWLPLRRKKERKKDPEVLLRPKRGLRRGLLFRRLA